MPPTYFGSFSMTQVGAPCLTSSYAAVRPAGPAPRMTTGSLTPNERKTTLLAPTLTRCGNLDATCDAFRSPSTRSASLCRRIRSRSQSQGVVRCRASGCGGGWILRPPGGPVDLDRHPLRGGSRVDQLQGYVRAGVGEQPRALADDHR